MRKLRILIVIIFILSCGAFAGYIFMDRTKSDNTPPVISFDSDTVSVTLKTEDEEGNEIDADVNAQLLSGVHAEDAQDGDLSSDVVVASMSHFTEPGVREVTYAVFDSGNLSTTMKRKVEYTDYTPPRIMLSEPLRYSLSETGTVDLTEYMTAQDCLDGDVTNQIRLSYNDSYYYQTAGDFEITAQVNNSAGGVCSVPLTVTITNPEDDNEADKWYPVLSDYIVYTSIDNKVNYKDYLIGLQHGGSQYIFGEDDDILPVKETEDIYGNVITDPDEQEHYGASDVSVSGDVDYSTAGTYEVEYRFTYNEVTAVTRLAIVVEE